MILTETLKKEMADNSDFYDMELFFAKDEKTVKIVHDRLKKEFNKIGIDFK